MSRRTFKGQIISAKMQKTVVVAVDVPKKHKVYSKSIKSTKKLMARNEIDAKLGDMVKVEECSPFSKNSSWKVVEKL